MTLAEHLQDLRRPDPTAQVPTLKIEQIKSCQKPTPLVVAAIEAVLPERPPLPSDLAVHLPPPLL